VRRAYRTPRALASPPPGTLTTRAYHPRLDPRHGTGRRVRSLSYLPPEGGRLAGPDRGEPRAAQQDQPAEDPVHDQVQRADRHELRSNRTALNLPNRRSRTCAEF
jgi:hypothetical protein